MNTWMGHVLHSPCIACSETDVTVTLAMFRLRAMQVYSIWRRKGGDVVAKLPAVFPGSSLKVPPTLQRGLELGTSCRQSSTWECPTRTSPQSNLRFQEPPS